MARCFSYLKIIVCTKLMIRSGLLLSPAKTPFPTIFKFYFSDFIYMPMIYLRVFLILFRIKKTFYFKHTAFKKWNHKIRKKITNLCGSLAFGNDRQILFHFNVGQPAVSWSSLCFQFKKKRLFFQKAQKINFFSKRTKIVCRWARRRPPPRRPRGDPPKGSLAKRESPSEIE